MANNDYSKHCDYSWNKCGPESYVKLEQHSTNIQDPTKTIREFSKAKYGAFMLETRVEKERPGHVLCDLSRGGCRAKGHPALAGNFAPIPCHVCPLYDDGNAAENPVSPEPI